jgi:hypothetical protein
MAVAQAQAVAHKSEGAEGETADQSAADIRGNKEVANSSKAVVEADMADVCPEGHTIYNNRNPIPSTSPHRLVSKSTGNNRSATVRRRPLPA